MEAVGRLMVYVIGNSAMRDVDPGGVSMRVGDARSGWVVLDLQNPPFRVWATGISSDSMWYEQR